MSLIQYVDQFYSPLMKGCKLADDISSMSISDCNEPQKFCQSLLRHWCSSCTLLVRRLKPADTFLSNSHAVTGKETNTLYVEVLSRIRFWNIKHDRCLSKSLEFANLYFASWNQLACRVFSIYMIKIDFSIFIYIYNNIKNPTDFRKTVAGDRYESAPASYESV